MKLITVKQFVALKPIVFNKVETKVTNGIALISQKREVIAVPLFMDCEVDGKHYHAGTDSVILTGDSGLKPWNKVVQSLDGKEFVLCPTVEVLAFKVGTTGV